MKLDISEIVARPGTRYGYDINEDCQDLEGVVCVSPVTGHIEFTNTGRLIVATGNLAGTVELECGRCLKCFPMRLCAEIQEHHKFHRPLAPMAAEVEEVEDVEELSEETPELWEGNLFDLGELIRQSLLIGIPFRPLCDEDCKGLCITCGANLNEGPCGCEPVKESPLAALGELLERKEEEIS